MCKEPSPAACLPSLPQHTPGKQSPGESRSSREGEAAASPAMVGEGEAQGPAEEQHRSAGPERNQRGFTIHRDFTGSFTHRSHPSYLPLRQEMSFAIRCGTQSSARPALATAEHRDSTEGTGRGRTGLEPPTLGTYTWTGPGSHWTCCWCPQRCSDQTSPPSCTQSSSVCPHLRAAQEHENKASKSCCIIPGT